LKRAPDDIRPPTIMAETKTIITIMLLLGTAAFVRVGALAAEEVGMVERVGLDVDEGIAVVEVVFLSHDG
jgi:hypothetical protein